MSKILAQNPNLRCFPPPNAVTNNLSLAINKTKEEGNVRHMLTLSTPSLFNEPSN
jgi:hypothetical protein